jgi:hypothetical protein
MKEVALKTVGPAAQCPTDDPLYCVCRTSKPIRAEIYVKEKKKP